MGLLSVFFQRDSGLRSLEGGDEEVDKDGRQEEHSQHQYCDIGLEVSRVVIDKQLLLWMDAYIRFISLFNLPLSICI